MWVCESVLLMPFKILYFEICICARSVIIIYSHAAFIFHPPFPHLTGSVSHVLSYCTHWSDCYSEKVRSTTNTVLELSVLCVFGFWAFKWADSCITDTYTQCTRISVSEIFTHLQSTDRPILRVQSYTPFNRCVCVSANKIPEYKPVTRRRRLHCYSSTLSLYVVISHIAFGRCRTTWNK